MIIIGIDPGLTGAVAAIDLRTGQVSLADVPTTEVAEAGKVRRRVDGLALIRLLRTFAPAASSAAVGIEAVRALPGNALPSQGSLMRSLGAAECALDILGAPVHWLPPTDWKKAFGLIRKKGEKDAAWKRRSVQVALRLYPNAGQYLTLARHSDRAEALLIAHHVRGLVA